MRYIVGEWIPRESRPKEQAHLEALTEWRALTPSERLDRRLNATHPPSVFDAESFLDGSLHRVFKSGRWEVFEVTGYSDPPY